MIIFLLLSLGAGFVVSQADPTQCCQKGYIEGSMALISKISCKPDSDITKNFTSLLKIMCTGFYEACCTSTAQTQFCQMGKTLAMANQLCIKGNRLGGEVQKTCCECCKRGRTHGNNGGSCDQVMENHFCTSKYQECCKEAKKNNPKVTPSKKKTCADISCDTKKTSGCTERSDGPQCLCRAGYVALNDGKTCIDIDECESDQLNTCSDECKNTDGGYECKCKEGFQLKNGKCEKSEATQCKKGFYLDDGECIDIDECMKGTHRCPTHSFCLNDKGDYRCILNCRYPNYQVIKAGVCADVDECKNGLDGCSRNHECVNSVGSFNCKRIRCDEGYRLTNNYCEDVDECAEDSNICGVQGICRNAYGRYNCDCQTGYSIDKKTGKCKDIDECQINTAYCNHQCINTEGSYKCTCPAGYDIRGRYCYDIDECATGSPCSDDTFCFNTFGSYACINQSCPNNFFVRSARKSPAEPDTCRKVDCHDKAECRNVALQSIKHVTYKLLKDVPVNAFVFNYYTSFSRLFYDVINSIVQGNEEDYFAIRNVSQTQIKLVNRKKITGPKKFHLIMHTDVSTRRGKLIFQYEYHFHVDVSAYNLY